ncbi:MAG TPA: 50S ribosomal protein L4, partial [Flavobacteriales bacterium]|nr:50S ribosomal protein L4 [Flavobacteriales bacterium]
KLNKKVKDLARRSALTYKAKDGSLKVIDTVSMAAPKTSEFAAILKAFELSSRKSVLVVPSKDDNIVLSARNLQNTRVVVASELNTYDIMNANGLLIVQDAIAPLETILTK